MDIITIEDLKVETIIGVNAWERKVKQMLVLNLEIGCDTEKCAATDNIDDALNYDQLSQQIIEHVCASEYQLIETLANKVADMIIESHSSPWLRLTVNKPGAIPQAKNVSITIERGQR